MDQHTNADKIFCKKYNAGAKKKYDEHQIGDCKLVSPHIFSFYII